MLSLISGVTFSVLKQLFIRKILQNWKLNSIFLVYFMLKYTSKFIFGIICDIIGRRFFGNLLSQWWLWLWVSRIFKVFVNLIIGKNKCTSESSSSTMASWLKSLNLLINIRMSWNHDFSFPIDKPNFACGLICKTYTNDNTLYPISQYLNNVRFVWKKYVHFSWKQALLQTSRMNEWMNESVFGCRW